MPGRIRQEDVEVVRERADIVKVVSGYLQLKKTGRDSLSGLCPFHPEKTPSFSVSPAKQVFFCFGCGEGGNVFRFLEKIENLTFPEAVERLAREVGIAVRYEGESRTDRHTAGRKELLHRANAEAGHLYHRMLLEGREAADARAYLDARGISKESVERFGVGYAPLYSDFLLRRLSRSYAPDVLVDAGLVTKSSDRLRDRFRGRVMFPIHDVASNAVGFGARRLAATAPDDGGATAAHPAPQEGAKYLNSPETAVYHKGSLLYNLNRAKVDIGKDERAFLVEGYTDVIAMDQAGIRTAVATCGTAMGEDHFRLLSKFTERVILAFDSDDAGARAAERAYAFLERYPVDLSVLILPSGEDPADFVLSRGSKAAQALGELVDQAVPLVEYMIVRALMGRPMATVEDRARAVRAGLHVVIGLEDPVRRENYARLVASRTGERETAVRLELEGMVAQASASQAMAPPGSRRPTITGTDAHGEDAAGAGTSVLGMSRPGQRVPPQQKVEREALKLLVQSPGLCPAGARTMEVERFATPTYRKVYEFLQEGAGGASANGDAARASSLVARAQERGEQFGRVVAALAIEPSEAGGEPTPEYAQAVFLRLEEFWLSRQIDELKRDLERLNPMKVRQEYEALFERLIALTATWRDVRVRAEAVGAGGGGR
jgi:DNA primase